MDKIVRTHCKRILERERERDCKRILERERERERERRKAGR